MPVGPYQQDVLTHIVNVQWGGGLAVEFGDKAADAPAPAGFVSERPAIQLAKEPVR